MQSENGRITFSSNGVTIPYGSRVRITSGGVIAICDATQKADGIVQETGSTEVGKNYTVRLLSHSGSFEMVAAGAITAGAAVYAAANGRVAASGTVLEGYAWEAAGSVAGDVIEVIPVQTSQVPADASVTAAKLAAALAADIPNATVAVADDGDGTGTITVQLTNAAGANLAESHLIEVLIGGAVRTAADIGTAGTFTPNTILDTVVADARYRAFTSATGSLVIPFTPDDVPDDVHVTVIFAGRTFVGVGTIAAV